MLFEEWRDVDAMLVWTGSDIARPRLLPGAEDLIDDLRITHYEALDIDAPPGPFVRTTPHEVVALAGLGPAIAAATIEASAAHADPHAASARPVRMATLSRATSLRTPARRSWVA